MEELKEKEAVVTVESFTEELSVVLKDSFVGQVVKEADGLCVRLVGGKCFHVRITE